MSLKPFYFKQFALEQDQCAMKIGTDGVLLGAWAEVSDVAKILDIGTGTGLIAIMLAQREAKAMIDGIELDEKACQQAAENMKNSPWDDRLLAIASSIQAYAKSTHTTYDLIVSNPPFFVAGSGTISGDEKRNHARHNTHLSTADLLESVATLLSAKGKFCVVLPLLEGLAFRDAALTYGFYCSRMLEIKPRPNKAVNRLLLQIERVEKKMKLESLSIRVLDTNEYSEAYIALTKDFYLKM